MKQLLIFICLLSFTACERKRCYICETKIEHKVRTAADYKSTFDNSSKSHCDITVKEKEKIEDDGYDYWEVIDTATNKVDVSQTTTITCK